MKLTTGQSTNLTLVLSIAKLYYGTTDTSPSFELVLDEDEIQIKLSMNEVIEVSDLLDELEENGFEFDLIDSVLLVNI